MTTRSQGISGTEVAALLGMSPYITRAGVYARKKGLIPDPVPDQRMRIGKLHEPTIVRLYEEKTGEEVVWKDKLVEHPNEPLIIGTPDGEIANSEKGFEAKSAGLDRAYEWGDGGDLVPMHYIIQCQHYMMLKGWKRWELAALIGGNDFRTFHLDADEDLQGMMLEEIRRFWKDHIVPGVMPEADWSPESKALLRKLYPSPTEGYRTATEREDEIIVGILQTRKELKFLERRKEELQNRLRAELGFAKGLTSTYGRVSLSQVPEWTGTITKQAHDRLTVTGKKGEGE